MTLQREDWRNHWQPATIHYRPKMNGESFRANSHGKMEERVRSWWYHHPPPRKGRLQRDMWSKIQNTLKAEKMSSSTSRTFSTETRQRSRVNISENKFPLRTSHQLPPPPYTSVKHKTSGEKFREHGLRSPTYTPPPPYTSPPNSHKHTGTLEPEGAFPDPSVEDGSGSRSRDLRQIEQSSVSISDRGGQIRCSSGTLTVPGSDTTQHLLELQRPVHHQIRNQQQVSTSQSGHEEKYPTSRPDTTLTKPRRRRRSEGTVFCFVSHTGKITALSDSLDDEPLKCQTLPHLKSSTSEENQLEDEDDSCRQLRPFTRGPTASEEPREELRNQVDHNVRLSKYVKKLRNQQVELRKESPEKSRFINPKKSKHEDTDCNEVQDHFTPGVAESTTPEETYHQTILKFPFWKEPRGSHCLLKSTKKSNRSGEGQCEQSEPRRTSVPEENMGLMVIDATCVLIKVEFIVPPEKEPVQYVSSLQSPSDSSTLRMGFNQDHQNTKQATNRRSELEIINGTRHTSSKVQPEHKISNVRAERILGIVNQDEEHTESESGLKAECKNVQIPKTSMSNRREFPSSVSEDKTMLEGSEVAQGDVVKVHTGHQGMTSTRQDNELQSADRKFTLDEEQVPDSSDGGSSVETEDEQTNSSETFRKKCKWTEDYLVHDMAERRDLIHAERAEDPCSDLLNSCERDTDQMFDQEHGPTQENPSIIFHNLQRTNSCSSSVKVCGRSLWDAVSRIRKHTAPDSETEEDEGDVWEPVEPSRDDPSEKSGMKREEWVLEERSGCAGVKLQDSEDAEYSQSSSSVESQDNIIETADTRNIPETHEEDEKIQKSDSFRENDNKRYILK